MTVKCYTYIIQQEHSDVSQYPVSASWFYIPNSITKFLLFLEVKDVAIPFSIYTDQNILTEKKMAHTAMHMVGNMCIIILVHTNTH
jgi:hypothetical protein